MEWGVKDHQDLDNATDILSTTAAAAADFMASTTLSVNSERTVRRTNQCSVAIFAKPIWVGSYSFPTQGNLDPPTRPLKIFPLTKAQVVVEVDAKAKNTSPIPYSPHCTQTTTETKNPQT